MRWIESLWGVSFDGGSGVTESLIAAVALGLGITVVALVGRRISRRRSR